LTLVVLRFFIKKEEKMELDKKKIKSILKNKRYLVMKLAVKTQALWIASEIIQINIEPKKTQKEIYEILKALGKAEYEEQKKQNLLQSNENKKGE